ncbi:MAG TPA: hypothetical protein VFB12_30195 [Ktedonobacteraceae bacterium]|nr:hypothetical protein [Ktedonobacteraceae bacterium]
MREHRLPHNTPHTDIPSIIFTVEDAILLKRIFVPYGSLLQNMQIPLSQTQLAKDTLHTLQTKMDLMIADPKSEANFPMDANEVIIIYTALWIFTCLLDQMEFTKEKESVRKDCISLQKRFAPVFNSLQVHTTLKDVTNPMTEFI